MRPVAIVLVLLARVVDADEPVDIDRAELAQLVWAATVDCARSEDDMARRQCEAVKQARAAWAQGKTFVAPADEGAIDLGEKDVTLRGCLACAAPLSGRFVVARGSVAMVGGKPRPAVLGHAPNRGKTAQMAARLRGEITFRLPARAETWSQGGATGVFVEAVGWRLWDPCDGLMLVSRPAEERGTVDVSTCSAEEAIPETPPTDEVRKVMQGFTVDIKRCRDVTGASGVVDLWLTIAGDGSVRSAEIKDELAKTPAANCIVEAAKKQRFPRFKRDSIQIHNKFNLR